MSNSRIGPTPELEALERMDAICLAFEDEWQAGSTPCLEEYLDQGTPEDRASLLFELLLIEYSYRHRRGELWQWTDYELQFPKDHDCLDSVRQQIEQYAGSSVTQPAARASLEAPSIPRSLRYIGNYEIIEELARGGMGVVFRARQTRLNRIVALKMLLSASLATPEAIRRFKHEAQTAARLQHSGIVPIHEIGEYQGHPWFTMDLVAGPSLEEKLREGPIDEMRAAGLVAEVAETVQFAHDQGILHRDLKPANILLDRSGRPKVADFGLAKLGRDHASKMETLTATGQVVGTPSYMSPEQAGGQLVDIDERTDVWALGGVLYCCLTGRPPFAASSAVDTLLQVMQKDPVDPRSINPDIHRDLDTICLKCLSKDRRHRYSTASELAEDLRRFENREPVVARPIRFPSKVWRWGRRHPSVALLGLLSAVLLILGTGFSTLFAVLASNRAELAERTGEKLSIALKEEQQAKAEAESAVQELQWSVYKAKLLQMQTAWEESDFGELEELLEATLPAVGDVDLRGFEWRFFREMVRQKSQVVATSPDDPWVQFRLNPQQTQIALRRRSGNVDILSTETLETIQQLEVSGKSTVAWNPAGELLAVPESGGLLTIWDVGSGQRLHRIQILEPRATGSTSMIRGVSWHPDGGRLSIGGRSAFYDVDISNTDNIERTVVPKANLNSLAWNSEGTKLALGGMAFVGLFDAERKALAWSDRHSGVPVEEVRWSPDDQELAAVWRWPRNRVHVYRVSGELIEFPEVDSEMRSIAWDDKGVLVASTQDNHQLEIWDKASTKLMQSMQVSTSPIVKTAWERAQNRILALEFNGNLRWIHPEPRPGSRVALDSPGARPWKLEFCPVDDRLLAFASPKGLCFVDVAEGRVVQEIPHQTLVSFSWHPRKKKGVLLDQKGNVVEMSLPQGKVLRQKRAPYWSWARLAAYSHDGKLLAIGSGHTWRGPLQTEMIVWGEANWDTVSQLSGERHRVVGAWHPEKDLIAVIDGGAKTALKFVDGCTGVVLNESQPFNDLYTENLKFDATGSRLAIGLRSGKIAILDVATGQVTHERTVGTGQSKSLEWSLDGRRLCVLYKNGQLAVFDPSTLDLLVEIDLSPWGNKFAFNRGQTRMALVKESGRTTILDIGHPLETKQPALK